MWSVLGKKLTATLFEARARSVRLRRTLRLTGQARLKYLDHCTIPVHDLAAARDFYCNVLGAAYFMTVDDETFRRFGRSPAANDGDGAHHVSVFMGGRTRIDLFLQSRGQAASDLGHPHYAFHVPPGQLEEWKRRLERQGIPVEGPLQLGPPGQASLYFNDPFGNHLEIVTLGFIGEVQIRPPEMQQVNWSPTHHREAATAC